LICLDYLLPLSLYGYYEFTDCHASWVPVLLLNATAFSSATAAMMPAASPDVCGTDAQLAHIPADQLPESLTPLLADWNVLALSESGWDDDTGR
jgi:hypothetical protein